LYQSIFSSTTHFNTISLENVPQYGLNEQEVASEMTD